MSMSNSKPSSCKSHTSKTNASIPKIHMSVSNSNTSKPSSCESDTSQTSSSKTNASIAKVDMSHTGCIHMHFALNCSGCRGNHNRSTSKNCALRHQD